MAAARTNRPRRWPRPRRWRTWPAPDSGAPAPYDYAIYFRDSGWAEDAADLAVTRHDGGLRTGKVFGASIEVNTADIEMDVYRSSGAGGQHVNKTESAVRLRHLPSGIVVACQSERSQHKNRSTAMKMLKAKLYELEVNKRNAAAKVLEDAKSDVSWGNQIRSYVLDQSRIKDLRTGVEIGNTTAVLDGDLDPFLEASLKQGL